MNVLDQLVADRYAAYHGDCVDVLRGLPDASVHYSVFSPPFASLYTYSASPRDMGNVATHADFFEQHQFMVQELYRVLKPGRLISAHCMLLPTSKMRDGFIGLSDFRGQLIRAFQAAGFIFHSEVVIWKDPVTAMQRTKALGLLHKQIKKDSCMSRQGIPDYLVTMRKPGDNPERVSHTDESFPVDLWQRYASPVWVSTIDDAQDDADALAREKPRSQAWLDDRAAFATLKADINPSDTLQFRSARADEDERHICPLQLEVIRRAVRLWTNPGDVVLSPFAGIGSEGVVSLQEGRRFVGAELKDTYYAQMCRNLAAQVDALAPQFVVDPGPPRPVGFGVPMIPRVCKSPSLCGMLGVCGCPS